MATVNAAGTGQTDFEGSASKYPKGVFGISTISGMSAGTFTDGQFWPQGTIPSGGGGITRSVTLIGGNTTLGAATNTDYVYACTATLTATLPTAVGNTNKYSVNNRSTGTVTVATTSSQTINGTSTFSIPTQYMSVDFISDGTNWMII